jgi:hypothetical protein
VRPLAFETGIPALPEIPTEEAVIAAIGLAALIALAILIPKLRRSGAASEVPQAVSVPAASAGPAPPAAAPPAAPAAAAEPASPLQIKVKVKSAAMVQVPAGLSDDPPKPPAPAPHAPPSPAPSGSGERPRRPTAERRAAPEAFAEGEPHVDRRPSSGEGASAPRGGAYVFGKAPDKLGGGRYIPLMLPGSVRS